MQSATAACDPALRPATAGARSVVNARECVSARDVRSAGPAMRKLGNALLTLAILLPACADDEVDGDVAKGWRATNLAIGGKTGEWQAQAEADGSLSGELTCPSSGKYSIEGSITDSNTFDVSIDFDGCSADGVTISGHLAMHAEVAVTDNSSRVHVDYQGELEWSGAAEGSCEIDMVADVAVAVSGNDAKVDASFHGEVCGYSADAVVDASAHG